MMNRENLNNIIQTLVPIALDEMGQVELMNRVDTKYVFPFRCLPEILHECKNQYRILEVNNVRNHKYDSLYFDTKGFMMYHMHHSKRLNRYKIRYRKYVDSNGLTFLEVKFKNNKEKTIKKRKKQSDVSYVITDQAEDFLMQHTPFCKEILLPALKIEYYRMTLVHHSMQERVTIDTFLNFDNFSKSHQFDNLVVTEVKRSSYSERTPFLTLLRKMHIREGGLSKYCTGMALTCPDIKKNNFISILRYFQKMNEL